MPEAPAAKRTTTVPLIVAAVAILVAVGALVLPRLSGGEDPANAEEPPVSEVTRSEAVPEDDPLAELARREPGDPLALGKADAPVVMISYSDFQCPFCGKFARETEPELIERYVDRGVLRIEWRDFPYLGPESRVAALGGRAAAQQDGFWEFHDAMYADQLPPNSGRLDEAYLVAIAEEAGLDVAAFEKALDDDALQRAVDEDFAEGQAIGVTGTPAFLVGGTPVMGAQPLESFTAIIDEAAAAAR
jgi:protein-disulfide isomerase